MPISHITCWGCSGRCLCAPLSVKHMQVGIVEQSHLFGSHSSLKQIVWSGDKCDVPFDRLPCISDHESMWHRFPIAKSHMPQSCVSCDLFWICFTMDDPINIEHFAQIALSLDFLLMFSAMDKALASCGACPLIFPPLLVFSHLHLVKDCLCNLRLHISLLLVPPARGMRSSDFCQKRSTCLFLLLHL